MNTATAATLARKCIACGNENASDVESCAACGSSLDLKLCPACEAINGATADRCHACGDVFVSDAREAPIQGRVLTIFQDQPYVWKPHSRRRQRFAMFLAVLLGMLSLPIYLLVSGMANRVPPAVAKEAQGVAREQAKVAPPAPAKASTPAAKTMEASGTVAAGVAAAPAPRPAGPVTGVTHTRRADAPVAKAVSPERTASVAPAKTATVSAEKATAAAVIVQRPAADARPTPPAQPHVRVTHTKATSDAAVPAAAVAASVNPVSEPSASAGNGRSPDCDERLAALGFCNSNAKGGGK